MARLFNQFCGLLGKNVLILMRSYMHLCFMYAIPLLIYLTVMTFNLRTPEVSHATATKDFKGFDLNMKNFSGSIIRAQPVIFTSPTNCSFCEKVLESLSKHLRKAEFKYNIRFITYRSESSVENVTSRVPMFQYICAITFDDKLRGNRETEEPVNLRTKLRFPARFRMAKWEELVNGVSVMWNTMDKTCLAVDCDTEKVMEFGTHNYRREGYLHFLKYLNQALFDTALEVTTKTPYFEEDIWIPGIYLRRFTQKIEPVRKSAISISKHCVYIAIFMNIYAVLYLIFRITLEKESLMKNALYSIGVSKTIYWLSWFAFGIILLLPINTLFLLAARTSWDAKAPRLISNTTDYVFVSLLLIYMCSNVSYCVLVSSVFHTAKVATSVGMVVFFMTFYPAILVTIKKDIMNQYTWIFFMCFLHNSAFGLAFFIIDVLEKTNEALSVNDFAQYSIIHKNVNMTYVLGFLSADIALYLIIAAYLETVYPGYGIAKKWHFCLTFWLRKFDRSTEMPLPQSDYGLLQKRRQTITISNLSLTRPIKKKRRKEVILNNINLNIFNNELTVFYGQVNSGSNELMTILRGNKAATSGTILVNGFNIRTELYDVHTCLGIYDGTHSFLFSELTFVEHIRFFTLMRGLSIYAAFSESEYYVELLSLHKVCKDPTSELSNFNKQLLAMCLAYCGGPKTVLLQNPCQSVEASKLPYVYNLILSEKFGRTTIITTNVMKQAYVLGDFIVLFSKGTIECSGSIKVIDETYGFGGYKITMVKEEYCDDEVLDKFVLDNLPQSKKFIERRNYTSYRFPKSVLGTSTQFFKILRKNRIDLAIKKYLIEIFNFEDFSSPLESIHQEAVLHANTPVSHSTAMDQNSLSIFSQFMATIERFYTIRKSLWHLYLLQFLLVILITANIFIFKRPTLEPPLTFDEKMFSATPIVLLYINESEVRFIPTGKFFDLKARRIGVRRNFDDSLNMSDYFLNMLKTKSADTTINTLYGLDYKNEEEVTCWFNGLPSTHMSGLCLAQAYGLHDLGFITNHPLPSNFSRLSRHKENEFDAEQLALMLTLEVLILMIIFIVFYIEDRDCGFKKLQELSGGYKIVYWLCAFVFDSANFMAMMTVQFLCLVFITFHGISLYDLPAVTMVHAVFSIPHLAILYCTSVAIKSPTSCYVTPLAAYSTTCFMYLIFSSPSNMKENFVILISGVLNPYITFFRFYSVLHFRNRCFALLKDFEYLCLSHDLLFEDFHFNNTDVDLTCRKFICESFLQCCNLVDNYYYVSQFQPIISLGIGGAFYTIILIILEIKLSYLITYWRYSHAKWIKEPFRSMIKVLRLSASRNQSIAEVALINKAFLIRNLIKISHGIHHKPVINNISLHGYQGESTAILSSGAEGVTELFRIMMKSTPKHFGKVYINGNNIDYNIFKSADIRISPIDSMLHPNLKVHDTIKFICSVGGLSSDETFSMCKRLTSYYKLRRIVEKKVKELDVVNRKIVGNIVSLIGTPKLILWQTPTEILSRDVKFLFWSHVRKLQNLGTTLLIETADLGECRLLTERIAVFSEGKITKDGTIDDIEGALLSGYLVTITMENVSRDKLLIIALEELYNTVRSFMSLKVERSRVMVTYFQTMVFYIPDAVPEHKLIEIMEHGMRRLPIVDYFIEHNSLAVHYGGTQI